MLKRFSAHFAVLSMFVDAILIIIGFFAALFVCPFLRNYLNLPMGDLKHPWRISLLFSLTWLTILLLFSLYDGKKYLRVTDELVSLIMGSFVAGITMAGELYFTPGTISREVFLLFWVLSFLFILFWHMSVRIIFRFQKNGNSSSRDILIIGAGLVGKRLSRQIRNNGNLGVHIVGFLDDDLEKIQQNDSVLGKVDQARKLVKNKGIDDVIVALPNRAQRRINTLVSELIDLPVKVWVIPDYFHLSMFKTKVTQFYDMPMVSLRAPALNDYQRMIKRALDVVATTLLMIIALPLMGIIGLVIWLDDPGPILFKQTRVGENGEPFTMYKFRTMVENAEKMQRDIEEFDEEGHLIHKKEDDPRVTKVGQFLRKTSLDELPQLFNVLKGEMSLVGPRPEMTYMVDRYKRWQRTRFAVPQGISGWWQVNGRSDKPMHLNTEDDIYYVKNYSLWLDIKILIKTIFVVLRGKGAY